MPKAKKRVEIKHPTVRFNAYRLISEAVEWGVDAGYARAHKHVENPDEDAICEAIHQYVMNNLSELMEFDDER